jgi:UPF0755 protein
MVDEINNEPNQGKLKRIAAWALGIVLLLMWVYADYRVSVNAPLGISKPLRLSVKKGQGVAALALDLRSRQVLVEPVWLRVLAATQGTSHDLKYGEYVIPPGTTTQGLLDILVSGKSRQVSVTIVEGWTFAQMRQALAKHPELRQEVAEKTGEEIMALLESPGVFPEGQFFPDTYFIGTSTADLDILHKSHKKMQEVLAAEWQARALNIPLNTPEEALTLASIVEKETGRAEERPAIAGVFTRRLQKGMRLQTDPTVIYGMGEGFKGNLHKEDLRRDTPYNTYAHTGLPPTPIALPGRQAIHAALNPAEGTSLYFVARGDGTHVFSSSLDEHERAVDKFQRHR